MKTFTVHHESEAQADLSMPDSHQDHFSKTYLGFWVYLMTDCLVFATLFVTYAVLHVNTFGGPSGKDLFDLGTAFAETMVLLFSSLTCGFAMLYAVKGNLKGALISMVVTLLLGATFLFLELREFTQFVEAGHSWRESAFLSSFFTLVGTHGLHITIGSFWGWVMVGQLWYQGINPDTFRRLTLFNIFWHFLDLVWIFIFTVVYLMGVA